MHFDDFDCQSIDIITVYHHMKMISQIQHHRNVKRGVGRYPTVLRVAILDALHVAPIPFLPDADVDKITAVLSLLGPNLLVQVLRLEHQIRVRRVDIPPNTKAAHLQQLFNRSGYDLLDVVRGDCRGGNVGRGAIPMQLVVHCVVHGVFKREQITIGHKARDLIVLRVLEVLTRRGHITTTLRHVFPLNRIDLLFCGVVGEFFQGHRYFPGVCTQLAAKNDLLIQCVVLFSVAPLVRFRQQMAQQLLIRCLVRPVGVELELIKRHVL